MIPISIPEAERLAAEAADKMCRRHWRMRYLRGQINRARAGFDAQGRLVKCTVFDRDEGELSEMAVLSGHPVEWLELVYTPAEGWSLPHD